MPLLKTCPRRSCRLLAHPLRRRQILAFRNDHRGSATGLANTGQIETMRLPPLGARTQGAQLRYKRSILGFLWPLLNPVLTRAVLTVVFSTILRFAIPNYAIFGSVQESEELINRRVFSRSVSGIEVRSVVQPIAPKVGFALLSIHGPELFP